MDSPALFSNAALIVVLTSWLALPVSADDRPHDVLEHTGMADASAAVAVDAERFVVANDEDNILRVYSRERGGAPLAAFNLNDFLKPDPRSPEVDIEAVTTIGARAYWISSHARNHNGKYRPSRHRFFATDFGLRDGRLALRAVGKPYASLLEDLLADPQLAKYRLAAAAARPPKVKGGFNIEGLAATPDGALLIGLRNPLIEGRAILLVLLNGPDVVGGGVKPVFGEPIELDLEELGIRSIEYWPDAKRFIIAAGPFDGGLCQLFYWSGDRADRPTRMEGLNLKKWRPEALVLYPGQPLDRLQLVSDDGRRYKGQPAESGGRSFRTGWINLP